MKHRRFRPKSRQWGRKPRAGVGYISHCRHCDKELFSTRKNAQHQIQQMHGQRLREYPCPVLPWFFHVGHLQRAIMQGVATRDEIYKFNKGAA